MAAPEQVEELTWCPLDLDTCTQKIVRNFIWSFTEIRIGMGGQLLLLLLEEVAVN